MGEPLGGPYQIVSFLWRSARPVCFPFPGAFAVISCRMRVRCLTLVRSSPQTVRGRRSTRPSVPLSIVYDLTAQRFGLWTVQKRQR